MASAGTSIDQLVAGTVLGAYRVLGRVGKGAMGDVYEVGHARLAGRYALKLLAQQAAGEEEAMQRFQREATIASSLRHPHIVQVIDFDRMPDGRPYLVMELLEGEDLHAHLRRTGPLPLSRVVVIIKQIASALAAAHGRGVVHRDLKPENIFLVNIDGPAGAGGGASDYVKIVDFGVSKVKSASLRLTKSGAMMGTPHYMAPEQAQGHEDVDEKADQFALGAIAYELLSGEVAFAGNDIASVVYQVVFGEPPRLVDAGGLWSPAIDGVIRRALAKAPDDRFESVAAFAAAFETAAASSPARPSRAPGGAPARPTVSGDGPTVYARVPQAGGRRTIVVAWVVILTAAVAGTIWLAVQREHHPPAEVSPAVPAEAPAPVRAQPAAPAPVLTPPPPVEMPLAPAPVAAPPPTEPERRPPPKPPRHRRAAPSSEEPLYNDL